MQYSEHKRIRSVREVIVVEGRYDKNAVAQVVDAAIIETAGFGVLSDTEKLALLRRLAEKRGLIILTDSDKAGFFIRGRLRGILGDENIKHAYIPDIEGRERRKTQQANERKLGVESMTPDVILMALERAGATFDDEPEQFQNSLRITKSDLFALGLSGSENSAKSRKELQKRLGLPERLSSNGLLEVLNIIYSRDVFFELINNIQNL